jgi:hypothetical protein
MLEEYSKVIVVPFKTGFGIGTVGPIHCANAPPARDMMNAIERINFLIVFFSLKNIINKNVKNMGGVTKLKHNFQRNNFFKRCLTHIIIRQS